MNTIKFLLMTIMIALLASCGSSGGGDSKTTVSNTGSIDYVFEDIVIDLNDERGLSRSERLAFQLYTESNTGYVSLDLNNSNADIDELNVPFTYSEEKGINGLEFVKDYGRRWTEEMETFGSLLIVPIDGESVIFKGKLKTLDGEFLFNETDAEVSKGMDNYGKAGYSLYITYTEDFVSGNPPTIDDLHLHIEVIKL